MAIVKSLTKKNCTEIGAEYIGKNKYGGIDYYYRGLTFNQEAPRGRGVRLILIKGAFFESSLIYSIFRKIYPGNTNIRYAAEFNLFELKAWMDSIADADEEAAKQAQAPISEEEIQEVTTEIRKQKQAAWHKLEEAKKFAWWENMDQTGWVVRQMRKVKQSFQEIDKKKDMLSEGVSNVEKRESLLAIYKTLERVQRELEELEVLTNSK